jgi:hypothetical protein
MTNIDSFDQLLCGHGVYNLSPEVYWYLSPTRVTHVPGEAKGRPLDFAMVLNNASWHEGVVDSMDVLMAGIEPKTLKGGAAAEAEDLLEKVRQDRFPHLPSRLRCFFLSADKSAAEKRANTMFGGSRQLVRCKLILGGERIHRADADIYERLEGWPNETLAARYWETFQPTTLEESHRLEILAGCGLYFPEWRDFPKIDKNDLMAWQAENPPPLKG